MAGNSNFSEEAFIGDTASIVVDCSGEFRDMPVIPEIRMFLVDNVSLRDSANLCDTKDIEDPESNRPLALT